MISTSIINANSTSRKPDCFIKGIFLTTTTFRLGHIGPVMAADSRVTFQDSEGKAVKCIDYDNYLKIITVNGVLYGFAGANSMYSLFLEYELGRKVGMNDVQFLDELASVGKQNMQEFIIMRYENELRSFGYLGDDIYDSSSEPLRVTYHAIGSGSKTKVYKKHKSDMSPRIPISKIIDTNSKATKKATIGTSIMDLVHACYQSGGDYGTGGKINMTTMQSEMDVVSEQVSLLATISGQAASFNAVAVCSLDASTERRKLESKGVHPSTKQQDVPSEAQVNLRAKLANEIAYFNSTTKVTTKS